MSATAIIGGVKTVTGVISGLFGGSTGYTLEERTRDKVILSSETKVKTYNIVIYTLIGIVGIMILYRILK